MAFEGAKSRILFEFTSFFLVFVILFTSTPLFTRMASANGGYAPPLQDAFAQKSPERQCPIYPLGLNLESLSGASAGDQLAGLTSSAYPADFSWLFWEGSDSDSLTLAKSFTRPGDSDAYVNLSDPRDRALSAGDWVRGVPDVRDNPFLSEALTALRGQTITVPVWDRVTGGGGLTLHRVAGFADIRIVGHHLAGRDRVSVVFQGEAECAPTSGGLAEDDAAVSGEDASLNLPVAVKDADLAEVHAASAFQSLGLGRSARASISPRTVGDEPPNLRRVSAQVAGCSEDMVLSDYQTVPGHQQFVDLTNVSASTILLDNCAFTALNAFTELSIGETAVSLTGSLAPGETFRVGSAGAGGVDAIIPDGALPPGPGALALLDAPPPEDGTPVGELLPFDVTGMVYLDNDTVYAVSHLRVEAHNAIYVCIYGGSGEGPFSRPFTPVADCLSVIPLDDTPPIITASLTPPPNANGWNNTDVTVSFQACDDGSGLASVTPDVVVTTEGAGQVITGIATDLAGNTASVSVAVNLDRTPPSVEIVSPGSGATVADPQVTLTGEVDDLLSGVAGVSCNGQPAAVAGGEFSCDLPLSQGTNSITVQATDAADNGASQEVTVEFVPNRGPLAGDDVYTVDEDTTLTVPAPGVLGNDSDPEGDPLTATLVAGPAQGALSLNADGSFDYTPALDFNGSVSFTYIANDGLLDSNIATATIAVNPVNDPPVITSTPETTLAGPIIDVQNLQVTFFPPTVFSSDTAAMDQTLGISNYDVEDFEDTSLIPGLSITFKGDGQDGTNSALSDVLTLRGTQHQDLLWDGDAAMSNTLDNVLQSHPARSFKYSTLAQ